jgi:hypothetical protein
MEKFKSKEIANIIALLLLGLFIGEIFTSVTGRTFLCILFLYGTVRVAQKRAIGWKILAAFYYFAVFGKDGATNGLFLPLCLASLYVSKVWEKQENA